MGTQFFVIGIFKIETLVLQGFLLNRCLQA